MSHLTVAELRNLLNNLDSELDNLPVGRSDGDHEYWGELFTYVSGVKVVDEALDGPKNGGVRCLLID